MPPRQAGANHDQDERDNAYYHWVHTYEKNLTQTAKGLEIPQRTLAYWKARDKWDERYLEETQGIASLVMQYAWNELRIGVSSAVQQLIKDATNRNLEHHERLQSQKLLFNLLAMNTKNPDVPHHLSLIDARQITVDPAITSSPSIQATKAIEANLLEAMNEQTKNRRGHNN